MDELDFELDDIDLSDLSEEELRGLEAAAVAGDWASWFEVHGEIDDAGGNRVKPMANYLQRAISEAVRWFKETGLPIRILVLKPRQRGCSTFSTAGLYVEANNNPINCTIIGAKGDQSKNLYSKVGVYSGCDGFDWGTKRDLQTETGKITFPDGRESLIGQLSAREYDPGRSGTYQFVLATEVARWAEDGVANAAKVLSGLVKCVATKPGTCILMETTAAGASGDFYERWGKAYDIDEFQRRHAAGEMMAGKYIRVFAPWFAFEELCHDLTPAQAAEVERTLGTNPRYTSPEFGDEREMMARFSLSLGQISWRRYAIEEECERDARIFEQDYPSTWETAFLTSGNKRFNSVGIRHLKRLSQQRTPDLGYLEWQKGGRETGRVVWRPTDEYEGIIYRWEQPTEGMRYSLAVDTMRGESQDAGKDPDAHSLLVLRAGYFGTRGWQPPAVVCRVKPPCRWDIDLVDEWCHRLWAYYNCLIVPEVNGPGLALIELLKLWGAPIYQREIFNQREMRRENVYGWETTTRTRPILVEGLARAIREYDRAGDGIELWCSHIVDELNAFVRKPNGREEAMDGSHDDDVIGLAIGLATIEGAQAYYPKNDLVRLPPDVQRLLDEDRGGRRGAWS
ncbi:hypothetical protein [Cerasicoccus frondis]|uniref:hypothetical protein n=1 Tax=Cerasicoccus frondis TaxID=490090 RepID=UPI002852B198|nr:hypothetical protein [Cerasicoccus frondis]